MERDSKDWVLTHTGAHYCTLVSSVSWSSSELGYYQVLQLVLIQATHRKVK